MLRALRFMVIAAVLLGGTWWIGTIPGSVTAHSGNYVVTASVPVAIVLLLLVAALFVLLLRLLGGVRRAPAGIGAWRGGRRQKLGEVALQRGLVALAAGDAAAAAKEAKRAEKLAGETPLVLLLTAESARLQGRHEQAEAAFRKLTDVKDMAFLGHKGLLEHHLALGHQESADAHALAAGQHYAGGVWLRDKRLGMAVQKRDWPAALTLTKQPAEIAAFATAAAQSAEPKAGLAYAQQALKAVPGFAPALAEYARLAPGVAKENAAKKALLEGWRQRPNPLIAAAYLGFYPTPIERAQAAAALAAARPGDAESELVQAETALAAKLTGEARRHAEAALTAGLRDTRVYAVLATLDNSREALEFAVPAPAWFCDNCKARSETWAPVCPHCGKAGQIDWQG